MEDIYTGTTYTFNNAVAHFCRNGYNIKCLGYGTDFRVKVEFVNLHRLDGPALEFNTGEECYFVYGMQYDKQIFYNKFWWETNTVKLSSLIATENKLVHTLDLEMDLHCNRLYPKFK